MTEKFLETISDRELLETEASCSYMECEAAIRGCVLYGFYNCREMLEDEIRRRGLMKEEEAE